MKWLKHSITVVVWTVIAVYALTMVVIHTPWAQSAIASSVASALAGKLGTRVEIGRVDLGFLNRIIIDDATIYDQQGKPLLQSARLSVKIDVAALIDGGRVDISSAQVFGARLALRQASATAKPNYQFALDSLASKDTTASKPFDVRVHSFIMRHSSIAYDRLDVAPTKGKLNLSHILLYDINANVQLDALTPDTLHASVRKLSFKEQSGLTVERLSLKAEGGRSGACIKDFLLRLPHSTLTIPSVTASYRLTGDEKKQLEKGSLRYEGEIAASTLSAGDFGWILHLPSEEVPVVRLSAKLSGTDESASLKSLHLSGMDDGLNLQVTAEASGLSSNPAWQADIRELKANSHALESIVRLAGAEPPSVVESLGDLRLSGTLGGRKGKTIEGDVMLSTAAGQADLIFSLNADKTFTGNIMAKDVALGTLTQQKQLGNISAALNLQGSLAQKQGPTVKAQGTIDRLTFNGYDYTGLEIDGSHSPETTQGSLVVNDANLRATLNGAVSHKGRATKIDLMAQVDDLCPSALNLTKKWGDARFSGTLTAQGQGPTFTAATGQLILHDFNMRSEEGDYHLEDLTLTSGGDHARQFITMQADFGHAEIVGHFDHATVMESLTANLNRHLPSLLDSRPTRKTTNNNFLVNAEIHDTRWLQKVVGVPLQSNGTIQLTGKIDDNQQTHYFNGSAPHLELGGQRLDDIRLALHSSHEALHATVSLTRVTDNDRLSLSLTGEARNDSLFTSADWHNSSDNIFTGTLHTTTHFTKEHGHRHTEISIRPSTANVDGKQWSISPADILIAHKKIGVSNFSLHHGEQHLTINGTASNSSSDTLTVDLNGIDVGYVLDLVDFHSVDFNGLASGRATVSAPFKDMEASAALTVKDFSFMQGSMGTLSAQVDWNKEEKRIDLAATAYDGPGSFTLINGYISPSPGYIDLDIEANGTRLYFMRDLTDAFLSDIGGQAHGAVRLSGPLKAIDLTGQLVVDGHASIEATGCTYYLEGDTVDFTPGEITLRRIPFTDRLKGHGYLSGGIHHKNLSRISYDLKAEATDMLVYNFKDFGDNTFYATVYATGNVGIYGGGDRGLYMDVRVTPCKNSTFTYNVSSPDEVASQDFIRWNDGAARHDSGEPGSAKAPSPVADRSDTRLDFAINMTPDATIRLLMDSKTKDYITLNGTGALNATYFNKGSFNMFGTYNVTGGTYGITIQNIIKKYFQFNEGGTITFRGDPYEADLDLQATYTVNGVSLSDLNIGSSFSNNTIRVNCLMNITGQPNSPSVDFDMDLPTVSADEKQLIRSVINNEDEMNQQVLYLLGIGRFYPQGVNNASAQGERQQGQTSLAMQSLLSGTLSSQINNVLGQVFKSNNWNFGANISTGDDGWNNAEYEGLLSGRLLNNRLLFNGQFGYRDNATTANTSFIGDFDLRYLLQPNGNLALKMYNQTNDRYFSKSSLNTQGVGLIIKRDFDNLYGLFGIKKKANKKAK